MNENKKHKSKKDHNLRKGNKVVEETVVAYEDDRLVNTYEINQLSDFLDCLEKKSNICIYGETYNALEYITHRHYIDFTLKYDWIYNVNSIDKQDSVGILDELFTHLPNNVDIFFSLMND